jgi:hypothetical protein
MRKRCAYCPELNDPEAMVCRNCGQDLSYAEEVYGAGPNPEASPDSPSGSGDPGHVCDCPAGQARPGADVCLFCDGRIAAAGDSAGPAQRPEPRYPPKPALVLPGGSRTAIGTGLLIGRDAQAVHPGPAERLAGFPGVSRRHVWIGTEPESVVLIDLGSRNGTWVEGVRLASALPHRVALAALPARLRLGRHCEAQLIAEETA